MNDRIQQILKYLDEELHPIVSPDRYYIYEELHDMISELAEYPEVIRCKNCKYWREHKYAKETKRYMPFCGFNAIYTKSDDFCSRAERRTDE